MGRQYGEYPNWVPPPPKPSEPSRAPIQRTSNRVTRARLQLPGAAIDSPIPIVYGRDAIAPLLFTPPIVSGSYLVMGFAWCLGEINGIEKIYAGEKPFSAEVINYLGTTSQGVDPWLASAIDNYADTLVGSYFGVQTGIAYSSIRLRRTADDTSEFKAIIQGKRVYDPRLGHSVYSTNPALCHADFIRSAVYGLNAPVNEASLIDAANWCDEMMADGSKRRTINYTIGVRTEIAAVLETLRMYSGCWTPRIDGEIHFIPNRPGTSLGHIDALDAIVADTTEASQVSTRDQPTVVTVEYQVTTDWPWRTVPETVSHPDVATGVVQYRPQSLPMTGIHSRSEARRIATQRLNNFTLNNLRLSATTFDEGVNYKVGQIYTVSHPIGITNKEMRIVATDMSAIGRWTIYFEEYDARIHSQEVVSDPSFPDTDLPQPDDVPRVSGLQLAEVVYETDKGFRQSRISVQWDDIIDADYLFDVQYRVTIDWEPSGQSGPGGEQRISEEVTRELVASSPGVQEGALYKVRVRAEGIFGGQVYPGDWIQGDITVYGNLLPPANVANLQAIEAGGEVFLSWPAPNDPDVVRYELRYGAPGVAWDAATFLERSDTLTHRTKDLIEGTYDVLVKAIDSVNLYSDVPARASIEVTFDPGTSFAAVYHFESASDIQGMKQYYVGAQSWWVTSAGETWGAMFPAGTPMSSYTNPLATYHAPIHSEFTTNEYEWARVINGSWSISEFTPQALSGTVQSSLRVQNGEAPGWEEYDLGVVSGPYDWTALRARTLSTDSTMLVTLLRASVRVSSNPKSESGVAVSSTAGPVTITLSVPYFSFSAINLTPEGAVPLTATYDNVVLGEPSSFDVYVFDQNNTLAQVGFTWEFKGI